MVDKLSFNINDARLVDENPESSFSILSLDFFASGPNKHDMFVSDDTLFKTADSIKNVPLVWKYDPTFDDAYTHDAEEVPCGFVPESAEIQSRKLDDGRTMLSVISYVWKKYSGKILEFFKRDGEKPVSVEMSVYQTSSRDDGLTELTDFKYEAVTVLGSYVQPAIPMARATVLQFADEYKKAVSLEFGNRYEDDIDFTIPANVQENAKKGLELYKKFQRGGNSVSIAHAKHLVGDKKTSAETIRQASRYITKRGKNKFDEKNPTNNQITFMLWGGEEGASWVNSLMEKMDLIDNKYTSYFDYDEEGKEGGIMPYGSLKDINPALKGIDPPITLGQANEIAKVADAVGSDKEKNGWAIAISQFKKTHKVENGHWVKKEKMSAEDDESDSDKEDQEYSEEKEFASEDLGKGEAISVDKSKEAMSSSSWGSVDKTALMHKVLNASNYKSLVDSVYAKVDAGWEDHPSSGLHYPIMQISGGKAVYNRYGLSSALQRAEGQGETSVVSKIKGLYSKLGLDKPDKEAKETKMAKDTKDNPEEEKKEEEKENPEEEKTETPEEEKKEEKQEPKEEKMSLDSYLDVAATLAFLKDETDKYEEIAAEFAKEPEQMNYGKVMGAMYAKMCKLAEMCKMAEEAKAKAEEENKAYMAENEELKKFKAEKEQEKFKFAVDSTLKDIEQKTQIPTEELETLREKSKDFSLENIEAWQNLAKARALDFALKAKEDDGGIKRYGLPFPGENRTKNDSIWKR